MEAGSNVATGEEDHSYVEDIVAKNVHTHSLCDDAIISKKDLHFA